jgi:hypothetical protein
MILIESVQLQSTCEAPRLGCDDPTGDQWSTHQNAGALLSWPLGHSWRWPFLHGEPFGDLLGYYMNIDIKILLGYYININR